MRRFPRCIPDLFGLVFSHKLCQGGGQIFNLRAVPKRFKLLHLFKEGFQVSVGGDNGGGGGGGGAGAG